MKKFNLGKSWARLVMATGVASTLLWGQGVVLAESNPVQAKPITLE